jgi:energy-coupling factor transport system ATP-binding protein
MERAQDHPYDLRPVQRRDLGLASVLAMATSILILDEPTTGQDTRGIDRLTRVLESLGERRRTVILITHDIEFCADRVERVVVFAAGKILIDDQPDQVFSRPDLLEQARVDGPQLVRLARALELPALPWEVERFVDVWSAVRGRGARK